MKSTNKRKPSGKLSRFYCLTVAQNWIFKKLSNKAANIIFTIYSSFINNEKGLLLVLVRAISSADLYFTFSI